MITVLVYALLINFNNPTPAMLGMLPSKAECDRIGTLLKGGRATTTYACLQYSAAIVSPTGTVPTIDPNSCAVLGNCLTTGTPTTTQPAQ